jgi:hypothetical protein
MPFVTTFKAITQEGAAYELLPREIHRYQWNGSDVAAGSR